MVLCIKNEIHLLFSYILNSANIFQFYRLKILFITARSYRYFEQ